jgi:hypothetical protein
MTDNSRDYIVGETIILTAGVNAPHSTTPLAAVSVALDALYCGTTLVPVSPNAFSLVTTGVWTFSLDTTGYAPGVYTWRAKAVTDLGIGLSEDTFVLSEPFGP